MSTPPAPAPFAATPDPPYYAVIFTSDRVLGDAALDAEYARTADEMERLARDVPGYLGIESARGDDGRGISVSYWASLEAIAAWRAQVDHRAAQAAGRARFYSGYSLRVARVERASSFASRAG